MTRAHFSDVELPPGAKLFVYALSNPDEFYGPFDDNSPCDFWSPPVEGDGIIVEYFIPSSIADASNRSDYFRISGVSHIYKDPRPDLKSSTPEVAGACNLNVTPEWANTSKSVGRLQFTSGGGDFVCSGTLLNTNPVTGTPYLLTANHCFATQTEAQSLRVSWNYNNQGSGGLPGPPNQTDGATLLATGTSSDFTLVRLTGETPPGLFLSGWDTSSPPAPGTAVTTIHHPQGDYKRISFGATNSSSCSGLGSGLQCIGVTWNTNGGVTEPGSSGAGLWKGDSSDPRLIGDLSGGSSSCATPTGTDLYGRFDVTFPQISSFLTPTLCVTALNTTSQSFSGSAGSGSVSVTAGSCSWTATSHSAFITVTSGASGNGNGTVSYSVAKNTDSQPRSGTILIGEQTFRVNQATACTFGFNHFVQSIPAAGGTASVDVSNDTGCSWQATSNSSFISITAGSTGTGSGTVSYSVEPNPGPARFGTLTIAGATIEVNQINGCTFTVSPTSQNIGASASTNTFNVVTLPGCDWIAINLQGFIFLNSGLNGSGPTGVTYSVTTNTGAARSGTISVAGKANGSGSLFTINQASGNPIDGAAFFVTQHYSDFLNRQPDTSGFNFWTNGITGCGNDQSCIDGKRTDTSAAFFLSIEFQNTGYLVYRLYKAAFGNLTDIPAAPVPVKRADFLADTRTIGSGVIVGQGNWQQQLDANKQSFTLTFVQRAPFLAAYPTSMTPAAFVNQLFTRAGVTPSAVDRSAAIAEFGSANDTNDNSARARALRDVAENSILNLQEFNGAFVLMQYFGYLQRNPYDSPEPTHDYQGYNFWLNKLNQFNGNYAQADMVRAFIVSGEYRQRFGP